MDNSGDIVRICSSGPGELELDDMDAYNLAHIRRFCETLRALLEVNERERNRADMEVETLSRG